MNDYCLKIVNELFRNEIGSVLEVILDSWTENFLLIIRNLCNTKKLTCLSVCNKDLQVKESRRKNCVVENRSFYHTYPVRTTE